jgi:hypothetical protein
LRTLTIIPLLSLLIRWSLVRSQPGSPMISMSYLRPRSQSWCSGNDQVSQFGAAAGGARHQTQRGRVGVRGAELEANGMRVGASAGDFSIGRIGIPLCQSPRQKSLPKLPWCCAALMRAHLNLETSSARSRITRALSSNRVPVGSPLYMTRGFDQYGMRTQPSQLSW